MAQRLQILLVEDDALDAELLMRALRRAGFDFDCHRVDTEPDFLEHLRPGLDLILSDCNMPQFSGLRALDLLKEHGLAIPFVIMSGSIGEATAKEAIKRGAVDCLLKGQPANLEQTIRHALERKQRS